MLIIYSKYTILKDTWRKKKRKCLLNHGEQKEVGVLNGEKQGKYIVAKQDKRQSKQQKNRRKQSMPLDGKINKWL